MDLFFRTYGDKADTPLIILHGLYGSSDNWAGFGRLFAGEGKFVIIPDQRNHGRSGRSNMHNYEAMCDDLLDLADKLHLDAFHLLGHSMGGKAAMQFCLDHPERIKKLIVADISPAASRNTSHDGLIRRLLSVDLAMYKDRNKAKQALKEKLPDPRLLGFMLKNLYWQDRSTLGWRVNLEVLRENLDEIFRPISMAAPITHPTLFLKGEHSDYITEKDIHIIHELFVRARIKIIPGGSHWLHADNPDAFAKEVTRFLANDS
jgi:esterase